MEDNSMPSAEFAYLGRPVELQLGHFVCVDKAVLAADPWAYVNHFLGQAALDAPASKVTIDQARFYWDQAERFAAGLPVERYEAKPLHLYYMMLNATKAMILYRRPSASPCFSKHGLGYDPPAPGDDVFAGKINPGKAGVFAELVTIMGDKTAAVTLDDVMGSTISVHRAYCTATRSAERFVPVGNRVRLRRFGRKLRYEMEIAKHIDPASISGMIPKQLEATKDGGGRVFRTCFAVDDAELAADKISIPNAKLRRIVDAIAGRERPSFYIRRTDQHLVPWSQLSLHFAACLALSSTARYEPQQLVKIFQDPRGWIVKEYLRTAANQFLALVASEITGRIIQRPYGDLG
jgi:hypothetical protein